MGQVGFSDKLGQVAYGGGGGPSFLGQQMGQSSDFSGKTAALIDEEVKILVERAYRRAKDLMQNNMPALPALAALLLEKENVDGDEFERMLQDMGCEQYLKADEPSIAVPPVVPSWATHNHSAHASPGSTRGGAAPPAA